MSDFKWNGHNFDLNRRMHPKLKNEWNIHLMIKYIDQFRNSLRSSELAKCFEKYIDTIWHTFVCVNLMTFNQQSAKCSMINDLHHSYIAHANGNDSTLKALNWTMKSLRNIIHIFPYFVIFFLFFIYIFHFLNLAN